MQLKRVLLLSFILTTLLFHGVLLGAEKTESWQALEQELDFQPWPSSYIDILRGWWGVTPQKQFYQPPKKVSLPPYEKMVYSLGWGAINGGYATLESDRRGDTLKLTGKAMSNAFVSSFYKVRDYVYSVGSSDGLYPYFFEQTIYEKEYQERRWTLYDFKRGTIHRHTGKEITTNKVDGFKHNFLSLLYALRTQDYTVGHSFTLPTYVHDKSYDIRFNILKKETLKTLGGQKECFKVQPILVGDGEHGFNKDDTLYLWITDDAKKIVVKIRAKARMGYVTCKLNYYTDGTTQWQK